MRGGCLLALVCAAFALRLGWQLVVGFFSRAETWEYDEIARNLVDGRGYVCHFLGSD